MPNAYSGAPFALLPAILALITALPLAGLAYAVSVLLHRISTAHTAQPVAQCDPDAAHTALLDADDQSAVLGFPVSSSASDILALDHTCPRCGAPISQHQAAAAIRWGTRWKGCQQCATMRASIHGLAR